MTEVFFNRLSDSDDMIAPVAQPGRAMDGKIPVEPCMPAKPAVGRGFEARPGLQTSSSKPTPVLMVSPRSGKMRTGRLYF